MLLLFMCSCQYPATTHHTDAPSEVCTIVHPPHWRTEWGVYHSPPTPLTHRVRCTPQSTHHTDAPSEVCTTVHPPHWCTEWGVYHSPPTHNYSLPNVIEEYCWDHNHESSYTEVSETICTRLEQEYTAIILLKQAPEQRSQGGHQRLCMG